MVLIRFYPFDELVTSLTMAFWNRSRHLKSKLNLYTNELSRYCISNHGFNVANQHLSSNTCVPVLDNTNYVQNNSTIDFFSNIRFYAAPVQANKKKQEKHSSEPKMNDQITTPYIRLVTDEGHSVVPLREAMARAKSLQMDLVEVDRHEKPPVCKIMDYHKEKYLEKLKEKERAKSKITLKGGSFKEVRFASKITQKDLEMKADTVKRFMESGYRVKCTAMKAKHDDVNLSALNTLVSQFWALIEDIAIIEGDRNVGKEQVFIVVRHIKFGPSKKSSGKKAPKDTVASDTSQVDSENISDESVLTSEKSEWDISNIDDNYDINKIFDEPPEHSKHEHVPHMSPEHTDKSVPHHSDASTQMDPPRYQMENRYAKRDMNNRGGLRNSQTLDQAKSPESDISEQTPQRRQIRPDQSPPAYNAPRPPPNSDSRSKSYGIFSAEQTPQRRQISPDQSPPAYNAPRPPPNSDSPSKSYGVFSAQTPSNTSSSEQKTTTEFNRYKKKE